MIKYGENIKELINPRLKNCTIRFGHNERYQVIKI